MRRGFESPGRGKERQGSKIIGWRSLLVRCGRGRLACIPSIQGAKWIIAKQRTSRDNKDGPFSGFFRGGVE